MSRDTCGRLFDTFFDRMGKHNFRQMGFRSDWGRLQTGIHSKTFFSRQKRYSYPKLSNHSIRKRNRESFRQKCNRNSSEKGYHERLFQYSFSGFKEKREDESAFLDLHLSISNDIVSTKIYDKRDAFDFEIVNFPFIDGDVPRSRSYGVYISQLICFARASSYITDFNTCNKLLTQKLLKQGYPHHKLSKTFSKFYRRYYDLISKFQVGLKSLLRQELSEPEFYGDLVYKLKKIAPFLTL